MSGQHDGRALTAQRDNLGPIMARLLHQLRELVLGVLQLLAIESANVPCGRSTSCARPRTIGNLDCPSARTTDLRGRYRRPYATTVSPAVAVASSELGCNPYR